MLGCAKSLAAVIPCCIQSMIGCAATSGQLVELFGLADSVGDVTELGDNVVPIEC